MLLFDVVPGLRREVEAALQRVLDTAIETRRLHATYFGLNDRFIRTRVGKHLVSYMLDVDLAVARVMLVEPIEQSTTEDPDQGSSSS